MIRRGIEQALMQAKHIVAGPLGRKIVESGAVSRSRRTRDRRTLA
jgi:hypothetical protein